MVYMYDLSNKNKMDFTDIIQLFTKACTKDDFIYQLYKSWNKKNNTNIINLEKLGKGSWAIDIKTNKFYYFLVNKENDFLIIPNEIDIKSYTLVKINLKEVTRRESLNDSLTINCLVENEVKHYIFNKVQIEDVEINKKRKRNEENLSDNKKLKNDDNIDWKEWISASSTRNYFLDDPLIDWLKEYNIYDINDKPMKKDFLISGRKENGKETFKDYILNEGLKFEQKIINLLKNENNFKIVQVCNNYQSQNKELYEKTLKYMKKGIDIIYQGILQDSKNKLYGSPDILIRSDIINKFIGYDIYDNKEKSSKLNVDWHYVVIDIKNSIIHLKSDTHHILNDGSVPAYKAQLYVYTKALNEIQGTKIDKAFIFGKKYTWNIKGTLYEEIDPFKKLGIIDYSLHDSWIVEKFDKFKEWILNMRKNGMKWSINPPSCKELYPNMKNEMETEYNIVKKQIAEKYYEITDVYYCNVEKRINCQEKGIKGWNDWMCTSNNLGFNNGLVSKRIDAILEINRSKDLIRPKKIETGNNYWRNSFISEKEYYIDFETINSAVGNYDDFVFMIGVGFIQNNKWVYKAFISEDLTDQSEKENLLKFLDYVDEDGIFYHWSNCEKAIFEKKMKKYNLCEIRFSDLNKFFVDNLIVVKGCLNWSLKTIAKKMYEYGFIKTTWNEENCKDGLSAMLSAHKIYSGLINKKEMINIEKYNNVDCKVMYEILNYLRINH
jgi:hypothetical protein